MASSNSTLDALLQQVDALPESDRLLLLQRLSRRMQTANGDPAEEASWSSLSGKGKGTWGSQTQIDTYLKEEREW